MKTYEIAIKELAEAIKTIWKSGSAFNGLDEAKQAVADKFGKTFEQVTADLNGAF